MKKVIINMTGYFEGGENLESGAVLPFLYMYIISFITFKRYTMKKLMTREYKTFASSI